MKVILAGMPKTGTKTMYAALNQLGYKTYDWMENFWWLGDDWFRIMKSGATTEDFKRMYSDVDAVTDTPCNYYWEELLKAFPDAKVILTVRDEDSLFRSRRKQNEDFDNDLIFRLMLCLTYSGWKLSSYMFYEFKFLGSRRSNWPWSKFNQFNYDEIHRIYRKRQSDVIQKCPKNNLLVYNVKQGWKPLCEFLGVEAPEGEFPRKNIGASLLAEHRNENKIMQRMMKELYFSCFCLSLLAAFVLYKVFTVIGLLEF